MSSCLGKVLLNRHGVRNSWFWRHSRHRWWVDLACAFNLARSVGSWGLLCSMVVVHGFSIFARKISNFLLRAERRPSLAPTKYRKNLRHVKGVDDASLVRGLSMTSKLDLFVNLINLTLFEGTIFLLFAFLQIFFRYKKNSRYNLQHIFYVELSSGLSQP